MEEHPFRLSKAEAIRAFESDAEVGLSTQEAERRLARDGPNQLEESGGRGVWKILAEQLTATLTLVLIVAAIVSAALGDYEDAIAILAIVVLNALLGVRQEYKAERAMAALKSLAAPVVKVRRDGAVKELSSRELVLGDAVVLEAGNLVPADSRLLESVNLRVQEAALTGESEPVDKDAEFVGDAGLGVADRLNMAHMGSTVAYGRGLGLVVATGMRTELGRIAGLIQTMEPEPSPLQRRLNDLGRVLAVAALAIVAVIFVLGVVRGEDPRLMFLTAVSLAVAAVPEGLPAVITIALSLGAQRMLGRNALIRKLPAVETLGSVTVICSDKTGTLTQNRMTARVVHVDSRDTNLEAPSAHDSAVELLLLAGALCNDAVLDSSDEHAVGDPTEAALVVAAAKRGLMKADLERRLPRNREIPFDSERKRMTTLHQVDSPLPALGSARFVAFTKGAADRLLGVSSQVWESGAAEPLTAERQEQIVAAHDRLAGAGMRVLGVAFRPFAVEPGQEENLESELVFIGLIGLIDPPRAEVSAAIASCRSAGMRELMITGDHPLTASSIAAETGLTEGREVLTGADLDKLSAAELEEAAARVDVYARVSPEHKLRLVEALQRRGHIVAMTGDGVNDAPALKKADIGVAMGITGTDVSKEAADMILRDDNFATIVAAVEEGRIIFDNIRKFIRYLLSANSGELGAMLIGPLFGMPLPLLPLQILWMNLVTDGPPALALGVERGEREVMQRPPRRPDQSVFADGVGRDIVWIGLLTAIVSLAVGYDSWSAGEASWQTMLFTTLTFSQLALALAIRSETDSVFTIGLLSNRPLFLAVVGSVVLQLCVVYLVPLQSVFDTVALSGAELGVCLVAGSITFWAVEAVKWTLKRSS